MSTNQKRKTPYIKLGITIAYHRKLNNFTQMELAEKAKVKPSHMGKIESTKNGISIDAIFIISEVL